MSDRRPGWKMPDGDALRGQAVWVGGPEEASKGAAAEAIAHGLGAKELIIITDRAEDQTFPASSRGMAVHIFPWALGEPLAAVTALIKKRRLRPDVVVVDSRASVDITAPGIRNFWPDLAQQLNAFVVLTHHPRE
jgi:hypothetical protein